MMRKHGWKGGGLGLKGDGRTQHIGLSWSSQLRSPEDQPARGKDKLIRFVSFSGTAADLTPWAVDSGWQAGQAWDVGSHPSGASSGPWQENWQGLRWKNVSWQSSEGWRGRHEDSQVATYMGVTQTVQVPGPVFSSQVLQPIQPEMREGMSVAETTVAKKQPGWIEKERRERTYAALAASARAAETEREAQGIPKTEFCSQQMLQDESRQLPASSRQEEETVDKIEDLEDVQAAPKKKGKKNTGAYKRWLRDFMNDDDYTSDKPKWSYLAGRNQGWSSFAKSSWGFLDALHEKARQTGELCTDSLDIGGWKYNITIDLTATYDSPETVGYQDAMHDCSNQKRRAIAKHW